ncbi:MAG: restriction endonuclease subunit S [Sulfurimonas sp.]|jgi:type I restriction enzyme S subunit
MSEMMQVPDGWEIDNFKSLKIKLIDGDRGENYPKDDDFFEHGYCIFLSAKNVTKNGFKFNELQFINQEKDEKLRKGKLEKEDIVLTTRGTVGNIAYFDNTINYQHVRINSGMILLRNENKSLKTGYLHTFLKSNIFDYQIANTVFGSAQPQLTVKEIEKFFICFPKEKKEQEKIAKILSTLDKSIEATNSLIEKEKNIKKALMQELLTNGIDKDGHIRTRATHTYKESELGLIPDEWEIVRVNKIAKVGSSKRIFEHEYVSEGVPFYRSTEIILKAHNKSVKSEIHISKDKFEEIKASYNVPQKDDILISAVGTIGVPYLVKNEQFYFKDGNLLWIQNIKINPNYLYLFVKSERFQDEINLIAGGSSQSALTIEKLSLLKVLYPKSIDEQKQIAKILTTQDKKIETEETSLAKLKELKKGLMNDLLSGKVRVKL